MKQEYTINSMQSLDSVMNVMHNQWNKEKYLTVVLNTGKPRSLTQNKALHKYCQLLAEELNNSGQYLVIKINEKESQVPWSMHTVKELMWKPIQAALTQKKSTTEPSTKDYPYIYEVLNRHTSEKLGVHVPWPCKENQQ